MDEMAFKDWLLVFTTAAAVLAPYITTRLNNRHALRVMDAQHQHEQAVSQAQDIRDREVRLEEHKRRIYDEVLQTLGASQLGIATDNKVVMTVHAQMARVWPIASAKVLERAKAVNRAIIDITVSKEKSSDEWDSVFRAVNMFCIAVRHDFASNVAPFDTLEIDEHFDESNEKYRERLAQAGESAGNPEKE
ncbi:hypothetical protein [Candidatus Neomicrothrix sp.]|uniref:hypothetical protein n=1 Tax=Candidatus Neomicrothrix sp. TaxID=2719034 RepID=UPI001B5E212D|nr:hypothetical protein [Candidatus Microthrix sp.]MBP6136721.1 hypothetical protein [Candidatus Microthrix sp.]